MAIPGVSSQNYFLYYPDTESLQQTADTTNDRAVEVINTVDTNSVLENRSFEAIPVKICALETEPAIEENPEVAEIIIEAEKEPVQTTQVQEVSDLKPVVVKPLVEIGPVVSVQQETLAEKVQKIFNELLIKEWYLPGIGKGSQQGTQNGVASLSPVLSADTMRDISSIRTMIEKSVELNGSAPIPNLVFVGKPGVGKTIAVQHLCESTGTPYVRIPSGAMEHHLKVSTAIPTLHKIFDVVEMCKKPVYIVMDDGEELVAKRPPQSKVRQDNSAKAHWLVEKENFAETMKQRRTALVNAILEESGKDRRNVGFAITTNRPEIIDPAFMTRARVIEFSKPKLEERKKIIIAHLPMVFGDDMHYLGFFHAGRLENMAEKTKGFTGRNLVEMLKALHACVQMEKGDIRQDMIDACICEQENAIKMSGDVRPGFALRLPEIKLKAVAGKLKICVKDQFNKLKVLADKALDKLTNSG